MIITVSLLCSLLNQLKLDNWNISGYMGFVVGKVALGQVFSEYFGFPCQSLFHHLLHYHHHHHHHHLGLVQ
jgi:hypothetical protein